MFWRQSPACCGRKSEGSDFGATKVSNRIAVALAITLAAIALSMRVVSAAPPETVTLCHEPGGSQVTLSVAPAAVAAHLDHGDYLGECIPLPTEVPTEEPT